MSIVYLVVSREEYDHIYSEHAIHRITYDESHAYDVFKVVTKNNS
jgi:hypothetical protein